MTDKVRNVRFTKLLNVYGNKIEPRKKLTLVLTSGGNLIFFLSNFGSKLKFQWILYVNMLFVESSS